RPARHPGRRANRQPRLAHQRRDHATAPPVESRGQDHHHGHARERHRPLGPAGGAHAGRPGRIGHAQRRDRRETRGAGRFARGRHCGPPGALDTRERAAMMIALAVFHVLAFLGLFLALLTSAKGRRSFVLALRSLWLHKLRSALSVLGIIIGTTAVITLMAFGEGTMHDALEDIKRMGATNIIVRSDKPPDDSSTQRRTRVATYGLTWKDYDRFATISTVTRRVPMRIFPYEVRYLDRKRVSRVVATTPQYAEVNELHPAVGRFLNQDDDDNMLNVAVLGSNTADRLFPFEEALGQSVRVGNYFYKVVGVLRERMPTGGTGGSQAAEDFNNDVYIPMQTCKVRFGQRVFIR